MKTSAVLTKPVKIVQLVDSLDLGGTERMSVNIANSLHDFGYESHLLVTRRLGGLASFVKPKVHLKAFNKKSKLDFLSFFSLLRHLKKLDPFILHAHQTSIFWAVLLKPFLPRTKLIWHDHFGQSEMLEIYPRNEMNWMMPYIDSVITVNDQITDYWKKRFPIRKESVFFLSNFPDFLEIKRNTSQNSSLSIINIANFRRQKDQLTLIGALAIIKQKGYKFQASLIGEFVDPDWLDLVKRSIIEHNLDTEVKILGPVTQLIPFLETANIGVLSSESEGLPVALLEYGMAALPTVATQVGQCDQVLGYGKFGWVVPPKSPIQLASAIEEVILDPIKAQLKGEEFKSQIRKNYGPENFMNEYREILSHLESNPGNIFKVV